MNLRFTPRALKELEEILTYVARDSPAAAIRVRARIEEVIALIAQFPYIGTRLAKGNLRRIVVTPFPYLIYFRAGRRDLVILAIRRAARDPGSMPVG